MKQDKSSKNDTLKHINNVQLKISVIMNELQNRGFNHDRSKLDEPEIGIFDKYSPKLKYSSYPSKEYDKVLEKMKPALDHHYANNRHHPEYFSKTKYRCNSCHREFNEYKKICPACKEKSFTTHNHGVIKMNLIDLIEMFCDWTVGTERHLNGNIFKSIDHNRDRFVLSNQLVEIFKNTALEIFEKIPISEVEENENS